MPKCSKCGIDCSECCNYLAGDCMGCKLWCDDYECECEIAEAVEWELEGQDGCEVEILGVEENTSRFEWIKSLTLEQLAKIIVDMGKDDSKLRQDLFEKFVYCKSACAEVNGCPHPVECCLHWLLERK